MKLGGSICGPYQSADEWGELLRASRFAAVTCPVRHDCGEDAARAYFSMAEQIGVTIAEIGVWKNPLSPDAQERRAAMEFSKAQLAFGDYMGIPCCVNIVGSRGAKWDGAYADNYAPDTYDAIVQSVREIIDAVKPTRCYYTIEPMPWMVPDGPDEYLQLLRDIDRPMFGVHLDFVNMINSPRRYLFASDFVDECLRKLSPHIISCHVKDIVLEQPFTVRLRETAPGQGTLDYGHILRSVDRFLPKGMPILLEHMQTNEEYRAAYTYVAGIAEKEDIAVR